jgi:uncharacterized protein (TIGR02996 family)
MPPKKKPATTGPSPELLSLLHAAKERLEDDGPRLVLADWLEEHGSAAQRARAELIRLQCDRAREPAQAQSLLAPLLAKWEKSWLGPLAPLVQSPQFERGLIACTAKAEDFGKRVFRNLAGSEELAWVFKVRLEGLTPTRAGAVADSPALSAVRELEARGRWARKPLGPDGADALLASSYMGDLATLSLEGCGLGPRGARAFERAATLKRLRALSLEENELGPEGATILAGLDRWRELEALGLGANVVGDDGVSALAASPHFPNVKRLDVSGGQLGRQAMTALASSPHWKQLRSLDLSSTWLSGEDLRPLFASTTLESLAQLNLGHLQLGAGLGEALLDCRLPSLSELYLSTSGLRDEGVKALADSPVLAKLTYLRFFNNHITDEGVRALAASPHARNLRSLDLGHNHKISEAGLRALADSPYLTELRHLSFRDAGGVHEEAIAILWASPRLPNLETVCAGFHDPIFHRRR